MKAATFGLILWMSLATSAEAASFRSVILAEADTYVFEAAPDRPAALVNVLSAGIGRGLKEGQQIAYVRFDLSSIPQSTLLTEVSVDSAELSLMVQSYGLADRQERFFVTAGHCPENDWIESKLTWDSRICTETARGEDSVIISGNDLPQVYRWNVTRATADSAFLPEQKLTFAIEAFKLRYSTREIVPGERFGPEESVGFVRFWSKERSRFGVNAVPTLTVQHSEAPTALVNFLSYTFAFLSAIGVSTGLYQAFKKAWH